ncbi:MAG TPA: hypothetical protein VJY84_00050 [Candidatus Saccharimonadales bacterium]|nr:hypothetical protein [Candidatus Saccharimonadales bacterium]
MKTAENRLLAAHHSFFSINLLILDHKAGNDYSHQGQKDADIQPAAIAMNLAGGVRFLSGQISSNS